MGGVGKSYNVLVYTVCSLDMAKERSTKAHLLFMYSIGNEVH